MPDKEQSPSVTEFVMATKATAILRRAISEADDNFDQNAKAIMREGIFRAIAALQRAATPDLGKDEELEKALFYKRQWHQESARAERLDNENRAQAARIEALHAEREKLREVLQEIADFTPDADIMAPPPHSQIATFAKKTARATLSIGETDYCGIVEDSPDAP